MSEEYASFEDTPRVELLDDNLRNLLRNVKEKRNQNRNNLPQSNLSLTQPTKEINANITTTSSAQSIVNEIKPPQDNSPLENTTNLPNNLSTESNTSITSTISSSSDDGYQQHQMPLSIKESISALFETQTDRFDPFLPISDDNHPPLLEQEELLANLDLSHDSGEDYLNAFNPDDIPQGTIDPTIAHAAQHRLLDIDLNLSASDLNSSELAIALACPKHNNIDVIQIDSSSDDDMTTRQKSQNNRLGNRKNEVIELDSSSDTDSEMQSNAISSLTKRAKELISSKNINNSNNKKTTMNDQNESDEERVNNEQLTHEEEMMAQFMQTEKYQKIMRGEYEVSSDDDDDSEDNNNNNETQDIHQDDNDDVDVNENDSDDDDDDNDGGLGGGFISLTAQREQIDQERDAKSGLINITSMHKFLPSFVPPWIPSNQVDLFHYYHASTFQRLHNEIIMFVQYLKPTQEETDQRNRLITKLREITTTLFPTSTLEVFGSSSTGTQLPFGDLDLVLFLEPPEHERRQIDHRMAVIEQHQQQMAKATTQQKKMQVRRNIQIPECNFSRHTFELIALYLQDEKIGIEIEIISKARIPVMKFVDRESGLHVDITLNSHTGTEAAGFMQQYIDEFPQLLPLTLVIKYFLYIRGLNDTFTGGIGSFVIQCMLIAMLQRHPSRCALQRLSYTDPITNISKTVKIPRIDTSASNLGILLFGFFRMYCFDLNYHNIQIDISNTGLFKVLKTPGGWSQGSNNNGGSAPLLSIINPHDMKHDISANSYNFYAIRAAFLHAYHSILNHISASDVPPSIASQNLYKLNYAETHIHSTLLSELLPVCPDLAEIRPHRVKLPQDFIEPRQILEFEQYCLKTYRKSSETYLRSTNNNKALPSSLTTIDQIDVEKIEHDDDVLMNNISVGCPNDISLNPIDIYALMRKCHSTEILHQNQKLWNEATRTPLDINDDDNMDGDDYDDIYGDSVMDVPSKKTKKKKLTPEEKQQRQLENESLTTSAHLAALKLIQEQSISKKGSNAATTKNNTMNDEPDYDADFEEVKKDNGDNSDDDDELDESDLDAYVQRASTQNKQTKKEEDKIAHELQQQLQSHNGYQKRKNQTNDGFVAPYTLHHIFPNWFRNPYEKILLKNLKRLPEDVQRKIIQIKNHVSTSQKESDRIYKEVTDALAIQYEHKDVQDNPNTSQLQPVFAKYKTLKDFRANFPKTISHIIRNIPIFKLQYMFIPNSKQKNVYTQLMKDIRGKLTRIEQELRSAAKIAINEQVVFETYINLFEQRDKQQLVELINKEAETDDDDDGDDDGRGNNNNNDNKMNDDDLINNDNDTSATTTTTITTDDNNNNTKLNQDNDSNKSNTKKSKAAKIEKLAARVLGGENNNDENDTTTKTQLSKKEKKEQRRKESKLAKQERLKLKRDSQKNIVYTTTNNDSNDDDNSDFDYNTLSTTSTFGGDGAAVLALEQMSLQNGGTTTKHKRQLIDEKANTLNPNYQPNLDKRPKNIDWANNGIASDSSDDDIDLDDADSWLPDRELNSTKKQKTNNNKAIITTTTRSSSHRNSSNGGNSKNTDNNNNNHQLGNNNKKHPRVSNNNKHPSSSSNRIENSSDDESRAAPAWKNKK